MSNTSNAVSNQSPRVNTGLLNTVNDPNPGAVLASPSGSIVQSYYGQVGGRLFLGAASALAMSDVAGTGTLFEGIYQYVQFKAASAVAPARGGLVVWSDRDNFIVTPDVTAATLNAIAGVALNAVTKGNWGFIQIAGKAAVKFIAVTTKVTPAIGDLVMVDAAPTNAADVLADATALTSLNAKNIIGIAIAAPVGGAISTISLRFNEFCF